MHALTERLNTPDKRIVAVVGALFDTGPVTGDGTSAFVASAWLCPAWPPKGIDLVLSYAAGLPGILFSGTALALELAERLLRDTEVFRQNLLPAPNADFSAWLQELQANFPWWCVFAGVSALIVARLLRTEVRMAQALEGTI